MLTPGSQGIPFCDLLSTAACAVAQSILGLFDARPHSARNAGTPTGCVHAHPTVYAASMHRTTSGVHVTTCLDGACKPFTHTTKMGQQSTGKQQYKGSNQKLTEHDTALKKLLSV